MTERLVVIGGDAAGMSAASQARRRRPVSDLRIQVFERSGWVSYTACGEPYHVAGDVDPLERLVVRTPGDFAERDIGVRVRHEVESIDLERRVVEVRDLVERRRFTEEFDTLMVATGTVARRGGIEGADLPGVHELRTLDDARTLRAIADGVKGRCVVVGGGYIGLEAAEAFSRQGWEVTVVTSGPSVLERTVDADLAQVIVTGMASHGIRVVTEEKIRCIEGNGRAERVGCVRQDYPADVVILGLGTRPEVTVAEHAGIPLGPTGAIAVDDRQRTRVDGVWSAGDCAEARHRVTGEPVNVHLGTVANKAGRVAGINLGGGEAHFPGVLGTAITKVCDTEVAVTGLRLDHAIAAGFDAVAADAEGTTTAGYWPASAPITIRVVAERGSGCLLGAQIVGGPGAGKRIDVFATALWNRMTVDDLAWVDLAYAPPFSGVWDLIHIGARNAARKAIGERAEEIRPPTIAVQSGGGTMAIADTIKRWFGKAKEEAAELSERTAPARERAKEAGKEALEKAREAAADAAEKAGPMVEKARDKAREVAAGTAEKAGPMMERAKEAGKEMWEKVDDRLDDLRAGAAEAKQETVEAAAETAAAASEELSDDDG